MKILIHRQNCYGIIIFNGIFLICLILILMFEVTMNIKTLKFFCSLFEVSEFLKFLRKNYYIWEIKNHSYDTLTWWVVLYIRYKKKYVEA